ncbi:MAG: DUF4339 domain-containing protein [Tepidisphaeraceae bacterium]|jgi:hypothetical protein
MDGFYINVAGKNEGPFTSAQLRERQIFRQTPVWHDGWPQWLYAEKVPDLADLICALPEASPPTDTRIPPPLPLPVVPGATVKNAVVASEAKTSNKSSLTVIEIIAWAVTALAGIVLGWICGACLSLLATSFLEGDPAYGSWFLASFGAFGVVLAAVTACVAIPFGTPIAPGLQ